MEQPPTYNPKSYDPVNNPSHYTQGGIECIDAMTAAFGRERVADFCRCNAFKYLLRDGKKDNTLQDLQKAAWYINKEIELATE